MMETLNRLLMESGNGDTDAFRQLYTSASPQLFALCKRLLRDETLAEDVLQEGFIKIWQNAAQFASSRANAMTWMTVIVRNHAFDRLRHAKALPGFEEYAGEDDPESVCPLPGPDSLHQADAELERLLQCLECIRPEQRDSILRAFYYGLSHDEIARHLMKPLGTVKAWIRRGLDQLRVCLNDEPLPKA